MALAQAHGAPRLKSSRTRRASIVALAVAAHGCKDGADGTAHPITNGDAATLECPRVEDIDGPDVSFERDLLPFFSTSCAFGGCHDGNTRQAGLYLGPNFLDGPANAASRSEVLASLLAQSTTAPSLHRVVPSDPTRSFLMIKIQGCQNELGLSCGGAVRGKPCGDRMPALSDELPEDQRRLLARWIARGAMSNGGDGGADGAASAP